MLRDTQEGAVVVAVQPGPLGGDGLQSPTLWRGDLVVSVNGQQMSAASWKEFINSQAPGTSVTIAYKRARTPDVNSAVAKGDPEGTPQTATFALAARSAWTGTLGLPRREGMGSRETQEGEFERLILSRADALQVTGAPGGPAALVTALAGLEESMPDASELPLVESAIRRPLSADSAEKPLAAGARACLSGDPGQTLGQVLGVVNLALDNPMLPDAVLRLPAWFSPLGGVGGSAAALAEAQALVRHHRDDVSIGSGDRARSNLSAIRRSLDLSPILSHLSDLARAAYADVAQAGAAHAHDAPRADVPPEIRAAVTGDVLFFDPGADGSGPLVIGGGGPNTYDMSKIARVYDVGGNDVYRYLPGEISVDTTLAPENGKVGTPVKRRVLARVVIDEGGDDVHEAQGDFCGPATGVFCVSILDDRQGNDIYRSSGECTIGAGLFGLGILIDRAGNDRYENMGPASGWSIGAGYYGSGVICDLGGDDVYLGEKLTQGVGGPRGLGAIIDGNGNDLYRASGPTFGSAYGTPAVYLSMSQGFGCGVRGYAKGGIGGIWDFAGDDRYEAGEFSQGCGYAWSLGLIHDFGGHDMYLGNRYSQGCAAHQAAGLLIDESGDDTYWSMTAAGQGAAWDQSVGMLVDRSGNDSYRGGGLSQGSAAQQGIGVLLDLAGSDRYSAYGGQGEGGGNEYHYGEWKIFSFSALIDLGGGADSYSFPGRVQGTPLKTGSVNEQTPEASSAWGVFSDE